jgi:hypothetical protein
MLAQVERAFHDHQPVVFLAWEPHPMNLRFDLKYLSGGDEVFGPNFGGATIYTVTRRGYAEQCPNVSRLLGNLKFTLRGESEMMAAMLDRHEAPDIAAAEWLRANPTTTQGMVAGRGDHGWQAGASGRSAQAAPPPRPGGFEQWVISHKIPVGDAMAVAIEFIKTHGTFFFSGISIVIRGTVDGMTALLRAVPAPALIVAAVGLAWVLRRSLAARGLRRAGDAVHFEPRLLAGDARDAVAGHGRHAGIHRHRRAGRNCGGASAALFAALHPVSRPDANLADLRLLDPDPGVVRAGRRAGIDIHRHIRTAGADSLDALGNLVGAEAAARGRRGLRCHADAIAASRWSCPGPHPPSSPGSPSASC